ncbi:MAG: hypothetical protein K2O18_12510 [Oscillospiraceae bacterium]|nr:hypothetical protein [Oscillospiraceae bacterium]
MASEYLKWKYRDVKPDEKIPLTTAEKRKNWWYYHKWHIVTGAVLLAILCDLTCLALGIGKVEPDYRIAYVGTNNLPDDTVSALEEGFAALGEDLNGDGRVVAELRQYASSGGADAGTAYSAEIKLVADLTECESYFFLLENPAQFQLNYHTLRRLDGSLPEDDDYSGTYLAWGQCPILAAMELGEYSYQLLDKQVSGNSNDLVSELFIARRGFWTENTPAYSEGADSLSEKLT